MRVLTCLAAASILTASAGIAAAQSAVPRTTLEKVRSQGYVQCGSVVRPGLAEVDDKGKWSGLNVEMCRAVATAVFGAKAQFAFHLYASDKDYASVRDGSDQIAFLSFTEMSDAHLTGAVVPGPPVFVESHDLLVAEDSPVKRATDLANSTVCFITATAPNNSLDAWAVAKSVPLMRYAFREDGEMYDTYAVQRCKSVVGEATELAHARLDGGINHLKSRFLPDHLASFPILATTTVKADSQWAAIVAWTVHTLQVAETDTTTAGGLRTIPVDGTALGLDAAWQKTVVATVGDYGAIFKRTLGSASPLKLERGLNALPAAGGLLVAPFTE